jgi:hypothetical protein
MPVLIVFVSPGCRNNQKTMFDIVLTKGCGVRSLTDCLMVNDILGRKNRHSAGDMHGKMIPKRLSSASDSDGREGELCYRKRLGLS